MHFGKIVQNEQLPIQSSFPIIHKVGNNAKVGIRGFTMWKQNIPVKILTPSE